MTTSNERDRWLDISNAEVEFVRTRLRLLEQQAAHSTTSPVGRQLIEAAFDHIVIKTMELELLLDQHTVYPKRGH